ncbi:MAG: hypothetical protein WDA47_00480 [Bacilli bacterium]|jgi:hypothetical protein
MSKLIKNISKRFAIAINTKQGVVTVVKGGMVPVEELAENEFDRLLNQNPCLIEVIDMTIPPPVVEVFEDDSVSLDKSSDVDNIQDFGFEAGKEPEKDSKKEPVPEKKKEPEKEVKPKAKKQRGRKPKK